MTDMNDTFKEYGFYIVATGGGCSAWRKDNADSSYYLVTGDDGSCIPETENDDLLVGYYVNDELQNGEDDPVSFYDFKRHFML
jgi:hypothetical protein